MRLSKYTATIFILLIIQAPILLAQSLLQVRLGLNSNEGQDRRLTRTVTLNYSGLNKKLFGMSYASIPVGYTANGTTWDMLVSSDPAWNRLVYGDYGEWVKAYGDWGTGNGQFRHPYGIDRSATGIIFVADTGNNRVVVLRMDFQGSSGNTSNTSLVYVTSITGLNTPYDVAWDDNGTTDITDDYLWILDSGNNRVLKYRFYSNNTFSLQKTYGAFGTGTGQFRHPRGIAVGRTYGVNDDNIYVADTGNQRVVRLDDSGSGITWKNTISGNLVYYTSVETDWYGGVWITDQKNHKIIKRDRYLAQLDTYGSYGLGQVYGSLNGPTDFSVYFNAAPNGNSYTWTANNAAFAAESWGDGSGGTCYAMGTKISYVNAIPNPCGGPPSRPSPSRPTPTVCSANCDYKLTDYARVTIWVYGANGQQYRTLLNNAVKTYGTQSSFWDGKDDNGAPVPIGNYYFRVFVQTCILALRRIL